MLGSPITDIYISLGFLLSLLTFPHQVMITSGYDTEDSENDDIVTHEINGMIHDPNAATSAMFICMLCQHNPLHPDSPHWVAA